MVVTGEADPGTAPGQVCASRLLKRRDNSDSFTGSCLYGSQLTEYEFCCNEKSELK